MRCQEGEGEEDDPPLVPRLGTRTGSTLLFSTTTRFCDIKQKRNYSFLTSRSIAKTSSNTLHDGSAVRVKYRFPVLCYCWLGCYFLKEAHKSYDEI